MTIRHGKGGMVFVTISFSEGGVVTVSVSHNERGRGMENISNRRSNHLKWTDTPPISVHFNIGL